MLPVPPRDPFDGGRLIVTRLENPDTGTVFEGRFDLGWVGRLTREQLDFVGLLVKHRTNVQRLAADVGIAYNTARARLDEIVQAMGGADDDVASDPSPAASVDEVLDGLASGQIDATKAIDQLRRRRG
ncbi:MAG: DUF2089 domain-containing protein [Gemmatimonadetes bacterium]|nr:DUF2089 domain-containing protein [Gemmatimonadota bacterium]